MTAPGARTPSTGWRGRESGHGTGERAPLVSLEEGVTPQEGVERGKRGVPLPALPRQSPGKNGNNTPPNQGFRGACLFGAKHCGLFSVVQSKVRGLQCLVLKALGEYLLHTSSWRMLSSSRHCLG